MTAPIAWHGRADLKDAAVARMRDLAAASVPASSGAVA